MSKLREFTDKDYYFFNGAHKLPSGREPYIYEGEKATVVIGGYDFYDTALSISLFGDEETDEWWYDLGFSADNEKKAFIIAEEIANLCDTKTLDQIGTAYDMECLPYH